MNEKKNKSILALLLIIQAFFFFIINLILNSGLPDAFTTALISFCSYGIIIILLFYLGKKIGIFLILVLIIIFLIFQIVRIFTTYHIVLLLALCINAILVIAIIIFALKYFKDLSDG